MSDDNNNSNDENVIHAADESADGISVDIQPDPHQLSNFDDPSEANFEQADQTFLAQMVTARKNAGLTQADVAQRLATTASVVARLESGGGKKRHPPSLRTLRKYANAVGKALHIKLVDAIDGHFIIDEK